MERFRIAFKGTKMENVRFAFIVSSKNKYTDENSAK